MKIPVNIQGKFGGKKFGPLNLYHRRICKELSKVGISYTEEYPVGKYSCDLYLPELGRLVEIDGPGHMRSQDGRRSEVIRRLRPELDLVRIKVGMPISEAMERILGS